jgi:hypothetical protein
VGPVQDDDWLAAIEAAKRLHEKEPALPSSAPSPAEPAAVAEIAGAARAAQPAPQAEAASPTQSAERGPIDKQHGTPETEAPGSEAESEPEPPTVQVPRMPAAPSAEQREQWRAELETTRQKLSTGASPQNAAEPPAHAEGVSPAASPPAMTPEPPSEVQTARPHELAAPDQHDRPTPTVAAAAFSDAADAHGSLDSAQSGQNVPASSGEAMHAPSPTQEGAVPAASLPPPVRTPADVETGRARVRPAQVALGAVLVAAVFALGALVGRSSRPSFDHASPVPAGRVTAIPPRAPEPSAASKTPSPAEPADLDPAALERLNRIAPAERTAAEATLLGRQWLRDWQHQFLRFSEELRKNPGMLEDAEARKRVMGYLDDRSTSVDMLELLAALNTPRALDIVYETWTGAKERTDTTRLAEALLLASDVRSRLPAALSLAMALRDKPTECETVRQLTQEAIAHGDRRSSMLLVKMGGRKDCTDGQEQKECGKCLEDPKLLRDAIRLSAGREAPPL